MAVLSNVFPLYEVIDGRWVLSKVGNRGVAPCQAACPAGIDVQGYVSLIAQGRHDEALALIKQRQSAAGHLRPGLLSPVRIGVQSGQRRRSRGHRRSETVCGGSGPEEPAIPFSPARKRRRTRRWRSSGAVRPASPRAITWPSKATRRPSSKRCRKPAVGCATACRNIGSRGTCSRLEIDRIRQAGSGHSHQCSNRRRRQAGRTCRSRATKPFLSRSARRRA